MKTKVLIVEDDIGVAKATQGALEDEGFEVQVGIGGKASLEILEKTRPNIILLDILMPLMDGVETLRRLRKIKGCEKIPVIAVTAVSSTSGVKKELETIDPKIKFIEKPYHIDELVAEIKKRVK
jgi:two-component system sensor histidine kinase/response regulator